METLKGRVIGVQVSTNAEVFVGNISAIVEICIYDKQDNLNLDLVFRRIDGGRCCLEGVSRIEGRSRCNALRGFRGGAFGPGVVIGLQKRRRSLLVAQRCNGGDIEGWHVKQMSPSGFGTDWPSR